jgi:hypothetical protein
VVARVDRRRFLLLAAAAPLALSSSVEAALKAPTKVPPARVRPLGTFFLLDKQPTIEVGSTDVETEIQLVFRSEIDVAIPYINIWPGPTGASRPTAVIPAPPLPPPVAPIPGVPRTPIPVGSPHRPQEQVFGVEEDGEIVPTELVSGVLTAVPVPITVRRNTCSASYRVTVQMSDGPTNTGRNGDPGPTRRRATISFMLRVVGTRCYTGQVADPQLPATGRTVNLRPTSRPAATKTPRLPPFRTATPTPV